MDYSWSPSRGTWVVILLVMVTLGHFGVTRQGSMGQLYQTPEIYRMGEKSRATLLFNKTRVINKGNKYRRTKVGSVPLKFKPLNPSDESPFLNYLLYKLTPKKKKKDTWITKVTAKFDAALREGGEEGDQGYTRTREREKLVMLDECGCERRVMVEESDRWQDRQESSCSYSSYRRG